MSRTALAITVALMAVGLGTGRPAIALGAGISEVTGIAEDDMLKLRAGPGTGYRIIVGLPNGTQVRNHGCDRIGGTPWCKVSLREVRGLKGYVSGHYLKDR